MSSPALFDDFRDLLAALIGESAQFIVVGAHAMAVHGAPRATGDLDVFVRPTAANGERVLAALLRFGAPVASHGVTAADFAVENTVYQIGLPPRRIDVLTSISGVTFDEAWATREEADAGGMRVPFLGREALIKNKRATGRPKDLVDVSLLEKQRH